MATEKGRALTITSNYCGDHAGQYIGAALQEAKSMEFLTLMENIKFERSISQEVMEEVEKLLKEI